ncbi:MAG: aminotransferase class V-fold PLP-dependent enzyme [Romboutsia sp.]
MQKYGFANDYMEGCHENILKALLESNLEQHMGYGEDYYCTKAKEAIKNKLEDENAEIHFVSGGTQANLIIISSILRPYESVISGDSGHINANETGSIEATGHKVCVAKTVDGKLIPKNIEVVLSKHKNEHVVKPRLVYISNSTEIGTIYTKRELEELSEFCKDNDLLLFMDGARLGSAICSKYNDLTLAEISKLVDVFYIGATKNGGLLGEAIVINNDSLKRDFRYNIKQKGGLLAKGRLLGMQFFELFKEDLYFDLANHANKLAYRISEGIEKEGYTFLAEAQTNQVFPILPNNIIEKLSEKYIFLKWSEVDENNTAIRLITSWATKNEEVESFIVDLSNIK